MTFRDSLHNKVKVNLYNNFGKENFDENRFGVYHHTNTSGIQQVKNAIKKSINYKGNERSEIIVQKLAPYLDRLEVLYNSLDSNGKALLLDILAYKLLDFRKVKLPLNNQGFRDAIHAAHKARAGSETYDPHFMHFILNKYDLNPIGFDIKIFFNDGGIAIDFIIEQYAYKRNGNALVEAVPGDTVLDLGACWGDTALYFASKVGKTGRVFSFEFIPDNIKLFKKNIDLNPHIKDRIHLVEQPVSNISHTPLYFLDNGPGSRIEFFPFAAQTGETTSITIDDFARTHGVEKIDFIKMDIEGAELLALKGAEQSIRKYRPKLAIAIYHSMDDFVSIPQWILNLDLGYELFIDHFTIYGEETVIFAKPRRND
jgi:FkbM family methyltransferase